MILLMGAAGAGKSLQGHALADEYGYAYISTGEMLRILITGERRQQMLQGKLLSDEEVITVVDRAFRAIDTTKQFILDGFPRTKAQIDWLHTQYESGRINKPEVINLEIEESVIRDRLHKRARPDDTDAAIGQRFADYQAVTRPLLKYMADKQIVVHDIDAAQPPHVVHAAIIDALKLQG